MFFVSFFVRSTISRQPAGRFTPNFACGRSLGVETCLLLFWWLAAPGGRKKGQMKFSLLWESVGNFCILAVFERYLSNACTDLHQILFMYVRPSVRLSDTRHNKVETAKHIIKLYSPSHSHTYHSRFSIPNGMAIFRLELLTADVEYRGWCENRDFRPTYRFI